MQINNIRIFAGKNIYSFKPVIRMEVDLGDLCEKPTCDMPGFNEYIVELFPGLKKHCCSLGYEGGFMDRLKEGTYIGHVIEHSIIDLQNSLGYDVAYGKTRVYKEPSVYHIIYQYIDEKCGIECGKTVIEIVSAFFENKNIDKNQFSRTYDNLKRLKVEGELGPSTKAIYDEAVRRGIPVKRFGNESILQLGFGKNIKLVEASLTSLSGCVAVDIVSDKHLTKKILTDYKIPVPYGEIVYSEEEAVKAAGSIGYPVVVKPYDGSQGRGVSTNLLCDKDVKLAYNEAIKHSKAVMVESYVEGKDYRILVVGDKVSAVSERKPPSVEGDGIHTISELVELKNQDPLRGNHHEKPLTRIRLDNVAMDLLRRNGYTTGYIPKKDEIIYLRSNTNLSTGGTAKDCTDEIHPENKKAAIKAAKVLEIDVAGIDMKIQDISMPISESNGAIIEVNAAPGLRMHLYPSEGKPRNVAADILDMLYPNGSQYSIPVVAITGTNGKTTTTRLLRHTLALKGSKVGMTTTSGIFIGDECIMEGDNTGPVSAQIVLSNKETEIAVLETARGGIVRGGLGYDLADVAVITNISDDHIGLDGIKDIEDLAYIKSLVIEAVKPEGSSVLNADDPMIEYFLGRARGNIILFSTDFNNEYIVRHINNGGTAAYMNEDYIHIYDKKDIRVMEVAKIPITFNGCVKCNIENSLAAASALYALGIPAELIEMGLKTFMPDEKLNPGRFNLFDMGDFKVLLDYGHNPAGFKCVSDFVLSQRANRYVGVIGVPGDRPDSSIRHAGMLCGKMFTDIYIKEDDDLRGREPGEVAELLYNTIIDYGFKKENMKIILPEGEALETAIKNAMPGDLIVMFYQNFSKSLNIIKSYIKDREKEESLV
ncbi:cyanophycin synthetase [Pseudobacteroides cellulosolvens]|uniref:Cyanophycin synthetase n=1 Tax=Pseudobacteroides cellulosolvens ATCC 35603 = DSM 2933 TaxID=398512 RepID=A0A0L6JSQ6_9FIRM|nr:cyanophycin synthetase [Pseudobacteroides cellulosolvens]KNY28719.1 cyanophycin synthetase [Pseudobacteroides cellulosolvens ATCC 35603 = DSM 2933]